MMMVLLLMMAVAAPAGSSESLKAHCQAEARGVTDPTAQLQAVSDCMAGKSGPDYAVAAPKTDTTEPLVKLGPATDPSADMPEQVRNTFCATSTDQKARDARNC